MRPSNLNLLRIEEELSAAHLRLARVYIENRPYENILTRFDRPHTFFYIDLPYYKCENYYGDGIFSRDDFKKLSNLLKALRGEFIMSINDAKEIRELFSGFRIEKVEPLQQSRLGVTPINATPRPAYSGTLAGPRGHRTPDQELHALEEMRLTVLFFVLVCCQIIR